MITSEVACPQCGILWLRSTSSAMAHQPKPYCSEKCEELANRPADPPAAEKCERCGYHDASKCEPDCPYELEPADRTAKCPVCPKCLSDVCDCQFAAAEKCECGHDEKHHHDGTGVWAKGCNQPIAMELGCPCKSCCPPAPEPAESEGKRWDDCGCGHSRDQHAGPNAEEYCLVCFSCEEFTGSLEPSDALPLEDVKAFADSREDAEGSIGSVYAIMAAFLESERPEIERKAIERFIITQMRNNQY